MTFTNISGRSIYLQCCHREVEPRGTFSVQWGLCSKDRGLRAAMAAGALAWVSGPNDPEVPGSPKLPAPGEQAKRAAARKAAAQAKRDAEAKAVAERKARDDRAVGANMARMGRFDVPKLTPRRKADYGVKQEAPVTAADIIRDDKPESLAAIVRHNKAIKVVRVIERAKAGSKENPSENSSENPSRKEG